MAGTPRLGGVVGRYVKDEGIQKLLNIHGLDVSENRMVTFRHGEVTKTMPVYILSMDTDKEKKRMKRIADKYYAHFGFDVNNKDKIYDLIFSVTTKQMFKNEAGDDMRDEYKSIIDGHTLSYITLNEISQYISLLSFLVNMLNSGYDRALFMENDINFIPTIHNNIADKNNNYKEIPWTRAPSTPDKSGGLEYDAKTFQSKMATTLDAYDKLNLNGHLLQVGSILSTTKYDLKGVDLSLEHTIQEPYCAMGNHAVIITKAGAEKLLIDMIPIWTRSDATIHFTKGIVRHEIIPNLIGQEFLWDVFKDMGGSSLGADYGIIKKGLNMNICLADFSTYERWHYKWGGMTAGLIGGSAGAGVGYAIYNAFHGQKVKSKTKTKKAKNNKKKSLSRKSRRKGKKKRTKSKRSRR
jgi:hypothetical protein